MTLLLRPRRRRPGASSTAVARQALIHRRDGRRGLEAEGHAQLAGGRWFAALGLPGAATVRGFWPPEQARLGLASRAVPRRAGRTAAASANREDGRASASREDGKRQAVALGGGQRQAADSGRRWGGLRAALGGGQRQGRRWGWGWPSWSPSPAAPPRGSAGAGRPSVWLGLGLAVLVAVARTRRS